MQTYAQYAWIFAAGITLRCLLAGFGIWQDTASPVKYTDIDYSVFTDAARLVAAGSSPFARATYRYTPLLAWLLVVVNGKLLFGVCDLLTAVFIAKINLHKHRNPNEASINVIFEAFLWILNPFVAVISTRGNAESIIAVLVLATVYFLINRNISFAAVTFGLAVHLKVYAIIYALPFWLFIDCKNFLIENSKKTQSNVAKPQNRSQNQKLPINNGINQDLLSGLIAFIPQLGVSTFIGAKAATHGDIYFALFAQTFSFVMLNKVVTSQYFMWLSGY
ncbi:GPI mannosyltransferase 1 [Physocladia obscura]|uniref:GPI mannosyltransferase 1 n=1 Tax=Physocladia obscura TaxID=109957 RepID=A0AAD5XGM5_9FUNG|nr:GPI mannosyltransferase 1 [Physocladia obscura]